MCVLNIGCTEDKMKKYTSYVNVFQGNGEINLPKPDGIAASWYFIKAQCGNTFPHAAPPFSKMTVGAYSGAYPTGYGVNDANYCGKVPKMYGEKCFCGFSHLHHSGTGAVGYYYNYALTAPFYGELSEAFAMSPLTDETAHPGYYSARKGDGGILCEASVTENGSAVHRFTFPRKNGRIAVDFGNNGLLVKGMRHFATCGRVKLICGDETSATAEAEVCMEGTTLYFRFVCRCADGVTAKLFYGDRETAAGSAEYDGEITERFGVCFDVGGKLAECVLSYSTADADTARRFSEADAESNVDTSAKKAEAIWEKYLSAIDIDADERTKRIFYSNLYHTLVKPSNLCGESFIYGKGTPFFTDFTTLWDIYKTQLPLVFALYRDEGKAISETLVRVFEALGYSPNCLTVSSRYATEGNQARCLNVPILMNAHICGCDGLPAERIFETMYGSIVNERNDDFIKNGKCRLYTHILDLSDACACAAEFADELGFSGKAEYLRTLSQNYVGAYDKDTGLLSDKSEYYEGSLYNYSFRLCADMEGRIKIAGSEERFAKLLDNFFGYGKPPAVQLEVPTKELVDKGIALGRFEGFNNEPDMETPYAYAYAGRHDRLCEVVRAGLTYMFTDGEGGIPGNNDSGAMSSCCIWNMLGIFPEAGHDRVILGIPSVRSARMRLSSCNMLEISSMGSGNYVKSVAFNGNNIPISAPFAKLSEIMHGGRVVFTLSEKPCFEK